MMRTIPCCNFCLSTSNLVRQYKVLCCAECAALYENQLMLFAIQQLTWNMNPVARQQFVEMLQTEEGLKDFCEGLVRQNG